MLVKRLTSFGTALVLSISSLLIVAAPRTFAASIAWGAAGNGDMGTGSNWTGNNVPTASDTAVFTTNANSRSLSNTGTLTFGAMQFDGSGAGKFTLTGNAITLNGNITVSQQDRIFIIDNDLALSSGTHTIDVAAGTSLILSGVVSGSGAAITKTGAGQLMMSETNTYTGVTIVNGGTLYAGDGSLGSTSAGTTVNNGADLVIDAVDCNATSLTVNEPLTLNGASSNTSGDTPKAKLTTSVGPCSAGMGEDPAEDYGMGGNSDRTITIAGAITLGSDVTVASDAKTTVTSALSGAYKFNLVPGYISEWVINSSSNASSMTNDTYKPAVFTKTLSDSQASHWVNIAAGAEITVTGTRGAITINGGTLKGTGTVGAVDMTSGLISPGMSPGVLNTGNLTFTGGTYQAEIGGTGVGEYDQLKVTGTVDLGAATTLTASLVNSFKPAGGNSFTLIDNDGTDAVTGTFSGLAEGATFTLDGSVFKISYVGGSGNDVVLTAQTLPTTPDTGLGLTLNNPVAVIATTMITVVGAAFLVKRYQLLKNRS